jgi:minimal CRISPR polymerase domain
MSQAQSEAVYFYGLDGDNIEKFMEAYLIKEEINALSNFSLQVTSALEEIRQKVASGGGQVLYCAGDNITFRGLFSDDWCEEVINLFRIRTGCTASMGIGDTALEFYLALKLAKSVGGGCVVRYQSGNR